MLRGMALTQGFATDVGPNVLEALCHLARPGDTSLPGLPWHGHCAQTAAAWGMGVGDTVFYRSHGGRGSPPPLHQADQLAVTTAPRWGAEGIGSAFSPAVWGHFISPNCDTGVTFS